MDQTPDQPFVLGSLNSRPNPGAPLGLFLGPTMWLASVALSVSLLDSHFSFPTLQFVKPQIPLVSLRLCLRVPELSSAALFVVLKCAVYVVSVSCQSTMHTFCAHHLMQCGLFFHFLSVSAFSL